MKTIILKILILGGTNFLGPHLVDELQKNGHEITLFNRGTQSSPFNPHIERLQGNREGDLKALKNRRWDAIIDTSGHLPRLVEASSNLLSNATKHYTFISTIGVYENFRSPHMDESYPLAQLDDEKIEEINEKTYGALKASCEKIIEHYFPDHCLIIRPGLIVGPGDPTRRFSYWPLRIIEGGEVLAPGSPLQNLQIIDARDLARWIVAMIEKQETGVYNATGPASSISFEELLQTCTKFSKKPVTFTWVNEDFLIENNVQDWVELPLWLSYKRNMPGFLNINVEKAIQSGLTFRPLSQTISAIIEWEKQHPPDSLQIGIDRKKRARSLKSMETIAIKTERLILRSWSKEDLEAFAALNADPRVMEYFPSVKSFEESVDEYNRIQEHFSKHGWGFWAVSLLSNKKFIGFIGLRYIDFPAHFTPAYEVGWRLAFEHWGKGYATEGALASLKYGFETLNLKEIISFTSIRNERSITVMERIGMKHDPADDFDHPKLPEGHSLRRHVLYRLNRFDQHKNCI